MTRAFVTCLGLATALLAACAGTPPTVTPTARIVVFTASDERIPRNTEVTLQWQAADAGSQDGLPSCVLTRRLGDEITRTPVQTTCTGTLTEVPPAPVTATTVEYRFQVLKQPYDANDPFLSETRSVTLDAALYATRAGGASGTSGDQASGVSALADGGAIVTGYFSGTATFGATTLTTAGLTDAFVARIDPDGAWAWAQSAGSSSNDRAIGVSSLVDGGAIVAGYFQGTAAFGANTLTSAGLEDAFVARIDPDGAWAWAQRAGGAGSDYAQAVSTLPDGGAIVAGIFAGTATFGTTTLTSAGGADAFVARIHPDGTWAWARSAGGLGIDQALGVSGLADGGAIVAGYFQGTAIFGATTLTSAGLEDAFVARVQSDGTWAWAKSAGGTDFDSAQGVSTLADGSAIVTGSFFGTATFGTTTLTSAGGDDAFVARIDPDGTWAWAKSAGGTTSDLASGVSSLADGSAIVTGYFQGTGTFGTTTLTSAGLADAFVARIDPDGTWTWAQSVGGTNFDSAQGVSSLADGGAIVTGYFNGTTTFGTTTLTSAGGDDAFVARIGADGAW